MDIDINELEALKEKFERQEKESQRCLVDLKNEYPLIYYTSMVFKYTRIIFPFILGFVLGTMLK